MILSFVLLFLSVQTSFGWQNELDEPLNFQCAHGESIYHITSEHHNHEEDRYWDFGCTADEKIQDFCFWSGYVNDYDEPIDFKCPKQDTTIFVLAGMSSIHDDHYEDRIWDYYCCELINCNNPSCYMTDYVNDFDEWMDYYAPDGYFITGTSSIHENHEEDRIWQYEVCTCN